MNTYKVSLPGGAPQGGARPALTHLGRANTHFDRVTYRQRVQKERPEAPPESLRAFRLGFPPGSSPVKFLRPKLNDITQMAKRDNLVKRLKSRKVKENDAKQKNAKSTERGGCPIVGIRVYPQSTPPLKSMLGAFKGLGVFREN